MKLNTEFQNSNPFRKPDWRFERVLKLCDSYPTPKRCSARDDPRVRAARNFVLRWRARGDEEREQLFWEAPGLFYAYLIHERSTEEPETALFVQARLLARQTNQEIADIVSTVPEAIDWYEQLFFNVRDRIDKRDWVTKQILLPALMRRHLGPAEDLPPGVRDPGVVARPFLDGSLKLFAYFGGAMLVDTLLSGMQAGKPLKSAADLTTWYDEHWSATIRRRSLQTSMQFEINKFNALDLFMVHAEIKKIENSVDALDKVQNVYEQHIKGLVDELPFTTGSDGSEAAAATALGDFDGMAAELRDDEVLKVADGSADPGLRDETAPVRLPPPRRKVTALD